MAAGSSQHHAASSACGVLDLRTQGENRVDGRRATGREIRRECRDELYCEDRWQHGRDHSPDKPPPARPAGQFTSPNAPLDAPHEWQPFDVPFPYRAFACCAFRHACRSRRGIVAVRSFKNVSALR